MQNRGNILFISSHLPSLNVPQAGQKIAYEMLKEYSSEYDIFLVAFYNEVEKDHIDLDDFSFCADVNLFEVSRARRVLSVIRNITMPVKGAVRADSAAMKKIVDLQRYVKFDVVHFEFTSAAYYMRYITGICKKVVTEHDVTYQAAMRRLQRAGTFSKIFYYQEYLRQKKWELDVLSKMDEIIVLNDKDRELLIRDGVRAEKIRIRPPSINPAFRKVRRDNVEKHSILFWGAMNRKENVDAVLWFIDEIYPLIIKRNRETKLYVVGAHPPQYLIARNSSNVVVTGFVDNPVPYFEKCHVAIAPIRVGAGVKIKVLEYLEAGLPVVATPEGAEGIADKRLIVADDEVSFASAVAEILNEDKAGPV